MKPLALILLVIGVLLGSLRFIPPMTLTFLVAGSDFRIELTQLNSPWPSLATLTAAACIWLFDHRNPAPREK